MNNRIHDAFGCIHAEEQLKNSTKRYLLQKLPKKRPHFARYAFAAFCCLLMLAGFGGYRIYMEPIAAISIDINPSMEWEVNRFDRIISITCYNRDARRATEHLKLKHKKYDDAMELLLASREMSDYLEADSVIDISVVSENEDKCAEMQTRTAECAGKYCNHVSHHTGNAEDMNAAHEAGLSFGKYQAFLILQELNPKITIEDVRGMCMREIQELINEYSGEASDPADTENSSDTGACTNHQAGCDKMNSDSGNTCENNGNHGHGHQNHKGHN